MEWSIGDLVRKLREFHRLSQGELAKRAKVHVSTVVAIEKGRNYEAKSLDLVAIALGYGAGSDLLSMVPPTAKPPVTSSVTPSPDDRPHHEEGDVVSDPFGRLKWTWERLPEDQQEAALDAMQDALRSFTTGGASGQRTARSRRRAG